jgi:RNA polymerase sigma-70 factor (ECF subfamily)
MTNEEFNIQLSAQNGSLYSIAFRLTGNRHNAKDLVQETIMRAFVNCHKFTEGTNFKGWLYTIMQNCYINEYRKQRTRSKVVFWMKENVSGVMEQSVKNLGSTVIMMKELRSILNTLSEATRIPFEMHFDGFGYQEIAEQLDVPLGTVKSRIFLARKKLKAVIQVHYGEHVQCA